jgi:glutamine amidotransferase
MTLLHLCDYGSGNIHNVERALLRAGAKLKRCTTGEQIESASVVVIPGVGAFGDCMNALRAKGFESPIKRLAQDGAWILGICVGMQILASRSEEFGEHQGLDLIPGDVRLIPSSSIDGTPVKRPHVGWSELQASSCGWSDSPLGTLDHGSSVYFVHSYQLQPKNPTHRLAHVMYGGNPIVAAVRNNRIFGLQFHPEKSGETGLNILQEFVRMTSST